MVSVARSSARTGKSLRSRACEEVLFQVARNESIIHATASRDSTAAMRSMFPPCSGERRLVGKRLAPPRKRTRPVDDPELPVIAWEHDGCHREFVDAHGVVFRDGNLGPFQVAERGLPAAHEARRGVGHDLDPDPLLVLALEGPGDFGRGRVAGQEKGIDQDVVFGGGHELEHLPADVRSGLEHLGVGAVHWLEGEHGCVRSGVTV